MGPQDAMSGVYNCMNLRRGCVFDENQREGTPLVQVKAHLPVSESFGFVSALRQETAGQAFPQCVFDHWENLQMGQYDSAGTKLFELVQAIRKRKSLKVEVPPLGEYLDKEDRFLQSWGRCHQCSKTTTTSWWHDLARTTMNGIGVKCHIYKIESYTSHVLFTNWALF